MTPGSLLPTARSEHHRFDVAVFGENSLDFVGVIDPTLASGTKRRLSAFDTFYGGQGATAALGCARLGASVRYIGAFGEDDEGRSLREALARERVDVVAIERPARRSRTAIILVEPNGDRLVFEHRDAQLTLAVPEMAAEAASGARVVLVDGTDLVASIAVAERARTAGAMTVVDLDRAEPKTVELLEKIDWVVLPEALARELGASPDTSVALRSLSNRFRSTGVVATMGEQGTLAFVADQFVRTLAYEVTVVDTTGAGDAFRAALCVALTRGTEEAEVEDLLEFANAAAALNCRRTGAQTGLPGLDDVRALVTARRPGWSKL